MLKFSAKELVSIVTEIFLTGLFSAALIICILSDVSILIALVFGLMIFSFYAHERGHSPRKIFDMWCDGVRPVRPILITLVLIGMLTALWRAAGVIPAIIFYAADFLSPAIILPMTFWLCGLVSTLTGTAFGSAATMGVICAALAESLSVPTWLTGGAVLSGIFLGDRCSPMSTSALLVATLTRTDIFKNLVGMLKTAIVPLILSSAFYFAAGIFFTGTGATSVDAQKIFAEAFAINAVVPVPAVLIIVLSLLRLKVQLMMTASILASAAIALSIQGLAVGEVLRFALTGYAPTDATLAKLLGGGGILSMANVVAIVCLSSCYAGIFRATGFLDRMQSLMVDLGRKFSPFVSIVVASVVTSMVTCNQTLAIMLTHQLCRKVESRAEVFALNLENSAVVISPLVPWAISFAVPATLIAAPTSSIFAAWYLWLIPLCCLLKRR